METENIDWTKTPFNNLVDYTVDNYHAYLERELPELKKLTRKILRVHGSDHGDVLQAVDDLFNDLKVILDEYVVRKEHKLFPLIKNCDEYCEVDTLEKILDIVKQLEDDYIKIKDLIKNINEITDNYTAPEDGCYTYDVTFDRLKVLEFEVFNHLDKEEVLLTRLKRLNG